MLLFLIEFHQQGCQRLNLIIRFYPSVKKRQMSMLTIMAHLLNMFMLFALEMNECKNIFVLKTCFKSNKENCGYIKKFVYVYITLHIFPSLIMMLKKVLIFTFLFHLGTTSYNETRISRSDKVGPSKIITPALLTVGQMASNYISGIIV